jgi:hypothetical protein
VIYLTVLAAALVVLLAYREYLISQERRDWQAERQLLITRIQDPVLGVAQHVQQSAQPDLPAVSAFDDTDYWQAAEDQMNQLEKDIRS